MGIKLGQGTRAVTVPVTSAGAALPLITAPCRLKGWSLLATGTASSEVDNSVTSPGAAAVICTTPSLPAGDYQVQWIVELEGTVAAAVDNDNFQLLAAGATVAHSVNQGAVGVYQQQPITLRLNAAATFQVRSIILATVGAVYRAQLIATPAAPASAQILDSAQVLGSFGAQFGFSDTEFLDEEGLYVSTSVSIQVLNGTVSGCIYVKDFIPESEL